MLDQCKSESNEIPALRDPFLSGGSFQTPGADSTPDAVGVFRAKSHCTMQLLAKSVWFDK